MVLLQLIRQVQGLARLTSFQVVLVLQICRSLVHGNGLDHVPPSFFPRTWKFGNTQYPHKVLAAQRAGVRASPHLV